MIEKIAEKGSRLQCAKFRGIYALLAAAAIPLDHFWNSVGILHFTSSISKRLLIT